MGVRAATRSAAHHLGWTLTVHPQLVLLSQERRQYLHWKRFTLASEIYIYILQPHGDKNWTYVATAWTAPAFQGQKQPEVSRAIGRLGHTQGRSRGHPDGV